MKEIKFRSWDGEDFEYFAININEPYIEHWLGEGNTDLQLFSGRIDTNKNEIYGKDIVKTPDKNIWEVLYNEETLSWDLFCRFPKCNPPQKDICMSLWMADSIEKIGNAYENLELLKEKNE